MASLAQPCISNYDGWEIPGFLLHIIQRCMKNDNIEISSTENLKWFPWFIIIKELKGLGKLYYFMRDISKQI